MSDQDDDLLKPDEIESLLKAARGESASSSPESAATSKPASTLGLESGDLLSATEIDALLKHNEGKKTGSPASKPLSAGSGSTSSAALRSMQSAEQLLDQAEADLAAALSTDRDRPKKVLSDAGQTMPFSFEELNTSPLAGDGLLSLAGLQDVELDLRIELGRTELLIEEVLKLKEGSVVPLDKLAGDPVDILVNGRLIARGEVLVLNDNFCVRIAEILTPDF
ncbi:MAG: flagellar motor switch protein FliN [Planctomycetaceae bacterium]